MATVSSQKAASRGATNWMPAGKPPGAASVGTTSRCVPHGISTIAQQLSAEILQIVDIVSRRELVGLASSNVHSGQILRPALRLHEALQPR